MLSAYDNMSLGNLVQIEISNVSVVYNSSMTLDQQEEAMDMVSEINMVMDVEIQDTAFVEYTMTMGYAGYAEFSFPGEMVCVKIGGDWYLAMLSFPNPFEV